MIICALFSALCLFLALLPASPTAVSGSVAVQWANAFCFAAALFFGLIALILGRQL